MFLSLSLCVRWIYAPAVQSCGMHVNYCSLARRTELATPRLRPLPRFSPSPGAMLLQINLMLLVNNYNTAIAVSKRHT